MSELASELPVERKVDLDGIPPLKGKGIDSSNKMYLWEHVLFELEWYRVSILRLYVCRGVFFIVYLL